MTLEANASEIGSGRALASYGCIRSHLSSRAQIFVLLLDKGLARVLSRVLITLVRMITKVAVGVAAIWHGLTLDGTANWARHCRSGSRIWSWSGGKKLCCPVLTPADTT